MFGFVSRKKLTLPTRDEALPGREAKMPIAAKHAVLGTPMEAPFEGMEIATFGMGCFWGAERLFWQADGVVSTAAGYSAGYTPNPTYEEVCSGRTGHNEVVRVVYDPSKTSYEALLKIFFENHDPTQGMRQGNDVGTQYRSGIYWHSEEQRDVAREALKVYQQKLSEAEFGSITTEVLPATTFYFAEDYHQQYLHKNPQGYCNHGFNGVSCPIGLGV